MKKLVIDKPKQWEVLSSPVRMEIVEFLELYGPESIAGIAGQLARTPQSLYHHFRQLQDAGIIQVDHTRVSGAREESVYAVCGRPVIIRYEPDTPRTRALRVKAARQLLRQAERDYEQAVLSTEGEPEVRRYRAPLKTGSVMMIKRHLDAIRRVILEERVDPSSQG